MDRCIKLLTPFEQGQVAAETGDECPFSFNTTAYVKWWEGYSFAKQMMPANQAEAVQ